MRAGEGGGTTKNPNPHYCVLFMVSEELIKNNREKTAQKSILGIESKWKSQFWPFFYFLLSFGELCEVKLTL